MGVLVNKLHYVLFAMWTSFQQMTFVWNPGMHNTFKIPNTVNALSIANEIFFFFCHYTS